MTEILGQIFGIIALLCNIVCYQMKEPKKLLFWQITASVMFTINLGLKGAIPGLLMNIHAIIRLLVYYSAKSHKWAQSKFWLPFFMVSAAVLVLVSYTGWVDAVALIGTLFTIYSFSCTTTAKTRLFTLPSPPCWFIYHASQRNIGGVLNEIFVAASIIVGMIRMDSKKAGEKSD